MGIALLLNRKFRRHVEAIGIPHSLKVDGSANSKFTSGAIDLLLVEPYKNGILPYWKFKTPDIARQSADKIYSLFLQYKAEDDFVGMDMARKFLQMGYTCPRRYANHKSGRKYAAGSKTVLPREEDPIKAQSARIFYEQWQLATTDPEYV